MNLYRKYRPQRFSDIVSQDFAVRTLKNILITRRIAHAYLFNGPRGTGKTSLAKVFAKALNCLDDTSFEPCLECKNCLDFDQGRFMDYFEIDAASRGKVQEMRDLIEKVKYAPAQGKYKVYVLDESHMLSAGASNAFLKTLEEPPEHVIFILATTDPHKILSTIKSRCQVFDFSRIGVKAIKERLEYVCKQEKIKITEEALDHIAYYAEGGLRDALSILDQLWAYAEDEIDEKILSQVFGTTGYEKVYDYIKAVFAKDFKKVLEYGSDYYENGVDFRLFTEDILKVLKDMIYIKWAPVHKVVLPFLSAYRDEIQAMDDSKIHSFLEILNNEYYHMRKSEDMKLALELVVYNFINGKVKATTPQVVQNTANDPGQAENKPAKEKEKTGLNINKLLKEKVKKEKEEFKPEASEQDIPENELVLVNAFDLAISKIEKDSRFIASCLRKANIKWGKTEKEAVIFFKKGYEFHCERTSLEKDRLADELMQILGKDISLDIRLSEEKTVEVEKEPEKKVEEPEVKDTLDRLSEEDEFIKALKKNIKVKKIEILEEDKHGKKI